MSAGTAQHERFPAALEDGYFHADALRFEQRVAMAAALAAQLRFVDLDNRDGGNWGTLFNGDTTLVLARIAAIDLEAMQARLTRDIDAAPLESLAFDITALSLRLDRWFKALDGTPNPGAQALRDRIRQLVEQQLASDLQWVQTRFGQRAWQNQAIGLGAGRLSGIWRPQPDQPTPMLDGRRRSEREHLRDRHVAFLSAIESIQAKACEMLEASLSTGGHEPAAALLIAFLKVHELVQDDLNRFAARHAEFYYRDCLGFQPRGAVADAALLVCQRDPRALGQVKVPAGALFDAGKGPDGRPLRFRADEPLTVTDAVVASLCTLRLERDPLISPERDFGLVTRAKATLLKPDGRTAWPTFGGGRGEGAGNARLGLGIASPLLLLAEGEREIRVDLRMRPDERDHTVARATMESLIARVEAAAQADGPPAQRVQPLRAALAALLTHWLLIDGAHTEEAQWDRVRSACRRVLGDDTPEAAVAGDPLSLLNGSGVPDRRLMFSLMFDDVFRFSLSAATGWLKVTDVVVEPAAGGGLAVRLHLRNQAPAIVGCNAELHGDGWDTTLPMLRIELSTRGRLYAYSLLNQQPLSEVALQVKVSGVRNLLLSNNLGRLDGTKAFTPFGPLPTLSSYFIVGSEEAARKSLRQWTLHIEWGGLPTEPGGFDTYYQGYDGALRTDRFTAALALLRDGQWQACGGASADQRLFDDLDERGLLRQTLTVDIDPGSMRKHFRASHEDWSLPTLPRNGLCRLQLSGPRGGFGHAMYPIKLSETVTANARTKHPAPLPLPPYTPLIERITADYEATSVIAVDRDDESSAGDDPERLLHLLPFGIRTLRAAAAGAGHALLPNFQWGGHLCIGLKTGDTSAPGGLLTLLFDMREAAAEPGMLAQRGRLRWSTLRQNEWRELAPSRVLSDSTHGFLTSGIVTLDLPRDLDRHNTVMPGGLYWLRVSADGGFEGFASLCNVRAQGLSVVRVMASPAPSTGTGTSTDPLPRERRTAAALAIAKAQARHEARTAVPAPVPAVSAAPAPTHEPLPEGRITKPASNLTGVASVSQIGPSFGLRAAEDQRAMYTRAGERLQHKNRATNAWDIERLLLDQFPEVFKVRCLTADHPGAVPGQITAVVVPTVPRNRPELVLAAPRFNALRLHLMAEALSRLASPFARIQVRNAAYERIQLRCSIGLARGAHEGATLMRLSQTLNDYLSPWQDGGYGPRFDWIIRAEDLEAVLRSVPGVAFVTRLSLLSVASDDSGAYVLSDTARAAADADAARQVRARTPWSLALPMPTHILSAADGFPDPAPQVTGVSKLAIGSTFVISGGTA
ncbi:hypothetical protein [Roseateles amylovorans]|uniref:Baseplate protein J-like domain-containing protein n=1 Tax=Roseateles amylovorans TaxID=2978473 RepID=A0ABY6B2L4_9BURK|nr:hypothetical protein [Roseateles amylovorans]UXH79419.1 hypothetical protein N4261_05680 [Roseateles amylovorans]